MLNLLTTRKLILVLLFILPIFSILRAQDYTKFYEQQERFLKNANYANALKQIDSLLKVESKKENLADLKLKKANLFTLLKFHDSAVDYLEQSMVLMRKFKDTNGLANAKTTLGILLNQINRPEEALEKFKKHYEYIKDLKDTPSQKIRLMKSHYNLGLTHYKLKHFDSAQNNLNSSLGIALKDTNYYAVSKIKGLLAQLNFEKGLDWRQDLNEALKASKKIDDSIGILKAYLTKAEFYLEKGQSKETKANLEKSKQFIKNSTNINLKLNYYRIKYKLHRFDNDFKNSLIALERYNSQRQKLDSILDNNNINVYNERLNYLNERLKTQQLLLNNERELRYLGLLISLLTIFIIGASATYFLKRNNFNNVKKLYNLNRNNAYNNEVVVEIDPEKRALFKKIQVLLVEKKLFLKQDISLVYISEQLKSNSTYVSEVINLCTHTNFRGYINDFRIRHAKQLIMSKTANNIYVNFEDISDSSGFKSKSSFYRVFKDKTELTPKEYLIFCKKEILKSNKDNKT